MSDILSSDSILNVHEVHPVFHKLLVGDARTRLKELEDNSVHLIVTSPPYGNLKNYSSNNGQIGYGQDYIEYYHSLMDVFRECFRVLHPGCRLVINIGDEFVQTTKSKPYHVVPHSAHIISSIINEFQDKIIYNGTIHWRKVTTSKTSGGGKIMGSVYTPRDGHFFVNYEHIIIFKKLGKGPKPAGWQKEESRFTLEERRQWFRDVWEFPPVKQIGHLAMFPIELPERIIKMYSFAGEVVLDPFVGSGTTIAAAAKCNRSAIGVDIGFTEDNTWLDIVQEKVSPYTSTLEIV